MNYITYDIETYTPEEFDQNKIDTKVMRVSCIGAYISWTDQYVAFLEEGTEEFLKLLKAADLVVGFNHIWFDNQVLQKYASYDLNKDLNNYDLMVEAEKKLGFKLKLDKMAEDNLGTHKTDSFEVYRHYHRDGKMAELIDYCMNDVLITERLWQRIQNHWSLVFNDFGNQREILFNEPSFKIKTTTTTTVSSAQHGLIF